MDAERWALIESVYHAALAKEASERPAYLALACAGDSTLQSEIESLLSYGDVTLSSPAERSEVAKLWEQIAGIPVTDTPKSSQTANVLPASGPR